MANERLRGVDEEAEGKGHEGGQEADHLTNEQKSASFQVTEHLVVCTDLHDTYHFVECLC